MAYENVISLIFILSILGREFYLRSKKGKPILNFIISYFRELNIVKYILLNNVMTVQTRNRMTKRKKKVYKCKFTYIL